MERKKKKAERSLNVVKQNDLVQKARYRLDLVQQKTIMYLISKINSVKDVEFQEISVDIKDLCEIMGIQYSGKNLKDFKDAIQKLSDKSIWVDTGSQIRLMRWLQRVDINKGDTSVTVRFDELMAPFLLQIRERFVQYKLVNVLPMKSQYSLRLYEILKSHETQGKWEVSLEELKKVLFIEDGLYEDYRIFRRKVLDSAVMEICNFTDLVVAYEPKRKNRKIYSLMFEMCNIENEQYSEGARRHINRDIVLDNLDAEVSSPQKMPTVDDIRKMRERKRAEKEREFLSKKFRRAKKTIDYFEDPVVMPGQTSLDDLF
jgi:plasmid replication initiation protein